MLSDSPHATPRLKRLAVRTAAVMCAIAVGFGLVPGLDARVVPIPEIVHMRLHSPVCSPLACA